MSDDEERTPSAEIKPIAAFSETCPTCGRVIEQITHPPAGMIATATLVVEATPHPQSGCHSHLVISIVRPH